MESTVSSLWIGSRISSLERLCILSFLANGHGFDLYVYEDVEGVPPGARVRDARAILPAESIFAYPDGPSGRGSFSAFSNPFRYKLLSEQGGWWVDMDVIAQKPLDFPDELVFAWETDEFLGTAILRLPAGSEVARLCLAQAMALGSDVKWGQAGPRLLTKVVRELGLEDRALPRSTLYPVAWDEWRELVTPNPQLPSSEAHAIHLWNEMLRKNGVDKEARFPRTSVIGRLQQAYD